MAPDSQPPAEAGSKPPPVKILLVDDQPSNLLVLEAVLGDLGQELVKARSGEEALRYLLDGDFAVILLDVQMQGLDGFATAKLIRSRERTRSTPIIFLTAYETPNFPVAGAYALGAVDYLVKPLVPAILRSKVAVFVELFQKSQQIRRQEEQLRRAQREQWRVTLASIGDGVIVTDTEGRITFLNARAGEWTGWGAEAVGRPLDEVFRAFDENNRERREDPVASVLRDRMEGPRYRACLRAKNDGERTVEVSVSPIKDETNQPTGVVLVFQDVTERKRAEESLRFLARASTVLASSLDYRTTLDRVAQLVVPWLADWCQVDMIEPDGSTLPLTIAHRDAEKVERSREMLRRFPWAPDAPAGISHVLRTGKPELYPEISEEILASVARAPEHLRSLREMGLKSGMCVPLISGGRTLGVLSLATAESGRRFGPADLDLAEHLARRAAIAVQNSQLYQKAREGEERFALVTDNVRDYAIFMLDRAGRVLSWNLGAERILGYGAEEILGQSAALFFTPADGEAGRLDAWLRAATESGRAAEDLWMVRKDGSRFWASGVTTALRDGQMHGYVKILRDLTERKTLEDELRRQTRELAEANERKDQFLAMLAHELRNPLAPLLTNLHILRVAEADPASLEQARAAMERQVRHLARLVDDLLDVSRVTRGKISLRRQPLDLAQLTRTTAEDRHAVLQRAGLDLCVDAPTTPVWIFGDAARLAQVLSNLLDNAVKFSSGQGTVTLRLTTDAAARQAVLVVRDEGMGIEADLLPKLFQPFIQSDRSLERARGGLGLGLAVAQGLTRLHGGAIEAASDGPGRGARFTIRLPLHAEPVAPTPAPPTEPDNNHALRILVVEDNRDAADSLRMLLELLGHRVTVAYSGPEGVQAASECHPDIVLCDIGLPGLNGYDVANQLRRNPTTAHAHLIAVTGYGQEEDRRRAREAGFDHHLTKPVDPGDLQPLLTRSL